VYANPGYQNMKIIAFSLFIAMQLLPVAYSHDKLLDQPGQGKAGPDEVIDISPTTPTPIDYNYAWDQFAHRGALMWECRGVQSGEFVAPDFCAFKEKVDKQWPDKNIPGHWKRR
jgi:hypothetical protein